MAYADADTGSRKLGAGIAVIAMEAGLVWALVTGLAYTGFIREDPHIGTFPVPTPTPTDTPPPPKAKPTDEAPRTVPQPRIPLGQAGADPTPTTEPPLPGGGETGIAPDPVPTVVPSPAGRPAVAARAAKPKGDASRWLSNDDYPTRANRERQEGRTGYRLLVDAAGRVSGCMVTSTSGSPDLDRATCALLPRRAKFEPARDETGTAVAGQFNGAVQWRLPPEE